MIKEDKDKIEYQLRQVKNVSILIGMMTKDVMQYVRETNCTQDEAVEKREKAYNFLSKYGIDYLETAIKTIREITNKPTITL